MNDVQGELRYRTAYANYPDRLAWANGAFVAGDVNTVTTPAAPANPGTIASTELQYARHNGKLNINFLDGHTEALQQKDTIAYTVGGTGSVVVYGPNEISR